jgi:hypothetical protein
MTTKIYTVAHIPEGLENAWLQHLRDFDQAHPDCHFEIVAQAPDKSVAEIIEILRVNPNFDLMSVIKTENKDAS